MNISKYQGVIPAFYACYDDEGNISGERTEAYTRWLVAKGVLEKRAGLLFGGVRAPLANLFPQDDVVVDKAAAMIDAAIARFI